MSVLNLTRLELPSPLHFDRAGLADIRRTAGTVLSCKRVRIGLVAESTVEAKGAQLSENSHHIRLIGPIRYINTDQPDSALREWAHRGVQSGLSLGPNAQSACLRGPFDLHPYRVMSAGGI